VIYFHLIVIIVVINKKNMAVKNYKAKIIAKDTIAHGTYRLKIEAQPKETFDFNAGQFATILVAPQTRRSYSIASVPGEEYIDLIADTAAGGPGSQFFDNAQAGQQVEFLFPLGNFVYKEAERPAYFFATGTGIVPFMSMIEEALEKRHTKRKLTLYAGFRYQESVFAKDLFEDLASKNDNFDFKLALSKADEKWDGLKGRITKYYEEEIQETNLDAYICGSHEMIEDVTQRLITKGIQKENINFEQFY